MIPYTLIPGKFISFLYNGSPKNFESNHPNFKEICLAVSSGQEQNLDVLVNVKTYIAKVTKGDIIISTDDEVLYKNTLVPDYLAQRVLEHVKSGFPIDSICAFAEKLMQNPNESVRNDLYTWLEKGKMPIYPDGDFVAYKLVRHDFTPIHKGPYGQDQSVGNLVEMPREECDESRYSTCSRGLHFCSYDYLPQFQDWNGAEANVVIVQKINPTDVVAIPNDYNDTKGRCCRFLVVGTVDPATIKATFGDSLVVHDFGLVEKGKVAKSKIKKSKKVNSKEFITGNGVAHTPKDIKNAMRDSKNVKSTAAKTLGVSRSTLSRWLKVIEG